MTHPDVRSVWHGGRRRGRRGQHPLLPIGLSRSRSSPPLLRHAVEPRGAQPDEGVEPRRHVPSLRVPRGCVGCVEEGAGRGRLLVLRSPSAEGAEGRGGRSMYRPVSHCEDTASPPRMEPAVLFLFVGQKLPPGTAFLRRAFLRLRSKGVRTVLVGGLTYIDRCDDLYRYVGRAI